MQISKLGRMFAGKDVGFYAAIAGAACFMLALILALLMLLPRGNPVFFIVWLAAFAATAAFMRVHRQWRAMFERIYAIVPARAVFTARKNWHRNVEDVAFRELPADPVMLSK